MRKFSKATCLLIASVLVLTLCLTLGFSVTATVAKADLPSGTKTTAVTVGHMSDVHYFPLEYCYQDVYADDYKTSDFYFSLTGDTKLVIESGNALYKNVMRTIEDAKKGVAPMYFLTSGDLTKNGERVAEIDVANALRYMQNAIRAIGDDNPNHVDYSNFQVFATVGNHDLYNGSGALYDKKTGEGWTAEGITAAQFALIYSGLGYPEVDYETLKEFYGEEYWSSSYTDGYIPSHNASNLTFTYHNEHLANVAKNQIPADSSLQLEYAKIGDELNQLSFVAEVNDSDFAFFVLDTTDREIAEDVVPVKVSESEFDFFTQSGSTFSKDTYFPLVLDNDGNETLVVSSKAFKNYATVKAAYAEGKTVYRNSGLSHLTGGRLTQGLVDFISQKAASIKAKPSADGINEKTLIATYHHNLLPHFEQEDDILKDFTLYNWEYTAKLFSNIGIRYTFTGHQHSSDLETYTDALGRTVYDFETGSFVSLDSPIRYATIARYNVDGKLAETCESVLNYMDSYGATPLKETPSTRVFTAPQWDESAYQTAITAYNANQTEANWQAVVDANPDYYTYTLHHDDFASKTYNEYIYDDIYSVLVERVLGHFVNDKFLRGTVDGFIETYLGPDSDKLPDLLSGYSGILYKMAKYVVNVLWTDLYEDNDNNGFGDYEHNGNVYNNVIEWVTSVAGDLLYLEFGSEELGKLTLSQMAVYVLSTATGGNEQNSALQFLEDGISDPENVYYVKNTPYDQAYRLRFAEALNDLNAQCDSGEVVQKLVSALLNPLFVDEDSLLKTLFGYKFDFTSEKCGLDEDELETLNGLLELINDPNVIGLLGGILNIDLPDDVDIELDVQANNLVLITIVNTALPLVAPIIENLLGFNLVGDNLIGIVQGFLDDYLVDSFYVGIGGILKGIIVPYATDDTKDIADAKDPQKPLNVTVLKEAQFSADKDITPAYMSDVYTPDASWQLGTLPGSLTANFDTQSGQDTFVISFYTAEDVFATVSYREVGASEWTTVDGQHWDIFDQAEREGFYAVSGAHKDNLYGKVTAGNVTIQTVTSPQYIPLIDLGLLCLTHGATYYDGKDADGKKVEILYTCRDRDNAPKNSVIYWNRHIVTISGLTAGTSYEYNVGGVYYYAKGAEQNKIVNSLAQNVGKESFTFTTAQADGDFEFLLVSDPQGMIQSMYDKTANAFAKISSDDRVNGYDFILNAGDMTDNGKNFYQWQYALNTMVDVYANTSVFFAAGNHESGSGAVDRYFSYTGKPSGDYYSFDYSGAHFIVLDTNDATSAIGLGEEQFAWLQADLKANENIENIFVIMHKSLFSTGAHANDGDVVKMREQLVPLFDEYKVDYVFGGHDHVYAESKPIGSSGTIYVTLGTIGTKFYEYTNDSDEVKANLNNGTTLDHTLTNQTCGYISVKNGVVTYQGYQITDDGLVAIIARDNAPSSNMTYVIVGVVCGVVALGAGIATVVIVNKKKKATAKAE